MSARLRQLGAREQTKFRTGSRQIWHSKSHDSWIQLTSNRQGNVQLAFYDSCPCSA